MIRLGTDRLDKLIDRTLYWIMDTLSLLFSRFSLTARVFHTGTLCQAEKFAVPAGFAYIHVLRAGCLRTSTPAGGPQLVSEPSLIFYLGPGPHHFEIDPQPGATLVCAAIDFGAGLQNPLLRGMPEFLVLPLQEVTGIDTTLGLLFGEAFDQASGRQAGIDRLMEYFLILLLRFMVSKGLIGHGVLAALADARLAKAIFAMHESPAQEWTLETLAQQACMSRARFAAHFRAVAGTTPLDYLTDWRISVAQSLLKRGQAFKMIAPQVGYSSPVALNRVFMKRIGQTPLEWLAAQKTLPAPSH